MKRILIVEDEKLIRQGIKVIIERSLIEVEEILESNNGEDAYSILLHTEIDVLITDIRMPKMDGIELVKKIQTLQRKPEIIVVSGYDDFNYAVEALRQGVREYLLKPIEREKLISILSKIQVELEERENRNNIIQQIGNQQFKYLILNQQISEDETKAIEEEFSTLFYYEKYVVINCNVLNEQMLKDKNMIVLHEINGHSLIIAEEKDVDELLEYELSKTSVGISKAHVGIPELRIAYLESYKARIEAFAREMPYCMYEEKVNTYENIPEELIEQFVQQFRTAKIDTLLNKIANIQYKAKINKIAPEDLLNVIESIIVKLFETYERIIEVHIDSCVQIRDPLGYSNWSDYYIVLVDWMKRMQQLIQEEFNDFRNKEKIMKAIQFIHENYGKDLNMAVVSNHISMNYSLFSLSFKEYTGLNFVNYLKKIRIDEAKVLLKNTDDKIIDISQAVGYENEKHFMKIFKKACGVSPTEYRKNMHLSK